MTEETERLAGVIRAIDSAERLYPAAASANAALATAVHPGTLLFAYLTLLQAAKLVEGEAGGESEWFSLRRVLDRLADWLEASDQVRLDALGNAWRVWTHPAALH